MPLAPVYIVAARRSALGRVGGLHRKRRLEDLAAPVLSAALADAGLEPARVGDIVIGNATAGGNAARLIALAAGLPDSVPACTVDRHAASGLEAIMMAARQISAGDCEIAIAGGAEAVSTAPWRVAKPRAVHQTPQFLGLDDAADPAGGLPAGIAASEVLARALKLGRQALDAYALRTHIKAFLAHEAKRFVGEIVALRVAAEEARDESLNGDLTADDLADMAPFHEPHGVITPGNVSMVHDGAAAVVVVSEPVWKRLGQPAALRIVAGVAVGVTPDRDARAPIDAIKALQKRSQSVNLSDVRLVEMSEASAAQAIALRDALGLDDDELNPDGGAIARGAPLGASGALIVTRLFTRMVRQRKAGSPRFGIAVQGARGGLGQAVLFEAI